MYYVWFKGTKGNHPDHPGYVPNKFSFKKENAPRSSRTSSQAIPPVVIQPVSRQKTKKIKTPTTYSTQTLPPNQYVTPHPVGHDYIHADEVQLSNDMKKYLPEIEERMIYLKDLEEKCESYKSRILELDQIKENKKEFQFWTGFSNYETFYAVFEFLEPRAKNLQYWKGKVTRSRGHFSQTKTSKPGPSRKLNLIDEFFLTMVRLRGGLLVEDLARRFNVSTGTVSSVVTSWVTLMYTELKMLCELPSRSVTSTNQSSAIGSFRDVQVILDCTELFVQNPSKLDARKQFFSNYKHHITYKFLVGISPQMGITYVSRMYGGRASDKFITGDSKNLLKNLDDDKGAVMADRGFLVEGILDDMGVKLYMPAFKGSDRPQLSAHEGEVSEKISNVRIHIERAIQRIKTYHILDGELKLSMKDIAEQVFTVCAYLVNFQPPIVSTK